jgi:hypothetical protein
MNHSRIFTECPSSETLTSVLLDGEGGDAERTSLEEHVKDCVMCSKQLEYYRESRMWIASIKQPAPTFLSRNFTAKTMEIIQRDALPEIWDDVLGISKIAVATFGSVAIILLAIVLFPEDRSDTAVNTDRLLLSNGITDTGEMLEVEELTQDDVVALALSGR